MPLALMLALLLLLNLPPHYPHHPRAVHHHSPSSLIHPSIHSSSSSSSFERFGWPPPCSRASLINTPGRRFWMGWRVYAKRHAFEYQGCLTINIWGHYWRLRGLADLRGLGYQLAVATRLSLKGNVSFIARNSSPHKLVGGERRGGE